MITRSPESTADVAVPRGVTFAARASVSCLALVGALLVTAAATSGALAVIAAASGAAVAGLSHLLLVRGLRSLLLRADDLSARPATRAAVGFVARHALVACALFVLLVTVRMPGGWILAGASVLPVGFALAGLASASGTGAPARARGEG